MSSSVLALEHSLIKVPFETLSKQFRNNQRVLEKEVSVLQAALGELVSKAQRQHVEPASAAESLDAIVKRLRLFKRKVEEGLVEEETHTERCRQRLEHIDDVTAETKHEWNQTRLDRILVDYLLREGFYESATAIAQDSNIEHLVDVRVFVESRRVEDSLMRHDCTEALAWCKENSSRLRKMQSTLEFNLRVQEFIELVRAGRKMDAIMHARKFLASCAETSMKDVQRAMATLAFSPNTTCPTYKALFDDARWNDLRRQFRHDNFVLHSLSTQSLLSVTLQAGLSAFKTKMCYQDENKSVNCPVCMPVLSELAETLPFSHRLHSSLVCRMSGELISDHNPPMVLPNGFVYGQKALMEAAEKHNGSVVCPRSGAVFKYSDAKKIFIM